MKFEAIKMSLMNGKKFKRNGWEDRYICFEDGKLKTSAMGKSVTWYPTAEELFADDWEVYLSPILMTQFEYDLLDSFNKLPKQLINKDFNDSLVLCDIVLCDMKDKGYFKNVNTRVSISVICNNAIIKEKE